MGALIALKRCSIGSRGTCYAVRYGDEYADFDG